MSAQISLDQLDKDQIKSVSGRNMQVIEYIYSNDN